MKTTKFQEIVLTIVMVIVMVYAMICYNIAFASGHMENQVFLTAFGELPIMAVIAFLVEFIFVGKIVKTLTFRILDPENTQPVLITLMISSLTVCFMCPLMSFFAAVLFNYSEIGNIISTWLEISVRNFPMALCWQLFYAGPSVRKLIRVLFKNN